MKKVLLAAVMCITVSAIYAQNDTTRLIDNIFSLWNNATPGGSVLVARGEEIIYHKAFGLADLEHNTPNTTETIFESGSVAKQFVAASVLLLASEGKISLKDDVRKYLPELPRYDATITVQHLVNHTSGLKDWGALFSVTGWPRGSRVYTQELALDIICKQSSLNFTPGSEYAYSNSNYVLLTFILERVAKQSLAEFTRVRFFEPLKMTSTRWRNNFREVIVNRSVAYARSQNVWYQEMPFENVHGPGGMLTTTGDLLKWNLQLATNTIGNDVFAASRVTRGRLNHGKEIVYSGGVSVGEFNGVKEISHSGSTAGYRAWLAYYPEKQLSVILLSNNGSCAPASMGRDIAAIFIRGKQSSSQENKLIAAQNIESKHLKKFEGVYKSTRTAAVEVISLADEKLMTSNKVMLATHNDTLHAQGRILVYLNDKKIMTIQEPTGDTLTYRRVQKFDNNFSSFKELAGGYYSRDTDAKWILEVKENELWVKYANLASIKLIPVFKDTFSTGNDGLVEFRRDKKGKVVGLDVSIPRAEKIPFDRVK